MGEAMGVKQEPQNTGYMSGMHEFKVQKGGVWQGQHKMAVFLNFIQYVTTLNFFDWSMYREIKDCH